MWFNGQSFKNDMMATVYDESWIELRVSVILIVIRIASRNEYVSLSFYLLSANNSK